MLFGYSLYEYQKRNIQQNKQIPSDFLQIDFLELYLHTLILLWSFAVAFHLSNTYKPCGPKLRWVRRPLPLCTDDRRGMISKAQKLNLKNCYYCPELAGKQLQRWRSHFLCFKHWELGLKQLLSLKLQIPPVMFWQPAYRQKWYKTG